jgi:hypothetical protein
MNKFVAVILTTGLLVQSLVSEASAMNESRAVAVGRPDVPTPQMAGPNTDTAQHSVRRGGWRHRGGG